MKLARKVVVYKRNLPGIPADFACDGCTWVVDRVPGPRGMISLLPACTQHDWCYALLRRLRWEAREYQRNEGNPHIVKIADSIARRRRKLADQLFRHETYHYLRGGDWHHRSAWVFALNRYLGVRALGWAATRPNPGKANRALLAGLKRLPALPRLRRFQFQGQ